MRNYSKFLRDIVPSVPGCPDIRVEREIVRATIDFFRRSEVWEVDIQGAANAAGSISSVITITSGVPKDTTLVSIHTLRYGEKKLISRVEDQIARDFPKYAANLPTGTPRYFSLIEEDRLIVMPAPVGVADFTAFKGRASVVPTDLNTTLPDKLYYQYEEAICARVLGKLMSMPQQDWTNVRLASGHLVDYENKITEIHRERKRRVKTTRITSSGNGYGA